MSKKKIDISIVIPVYNSSNNLFKLLNEIHLNQDLKKINKEILLVDDFSNLQTQSLLGKIKKKFTNIKIIRLKKNSGQHYSTLVGIDKSKGDFIATLDDDLEHSPKSIIKMMNYLKKYNYDVVFENNVLNKNWFRNLTSKINQHLIRKIFGLNNNKKTSSFRLIKKKFAKKMLNKYYYNPNISCMILDETHNIGNLKVNYKSAVSNSRYSFLSLLNLNKAVIFDYSDWVIKFMIRFLTIICLLSLIYGVYTFVDQIKKTNSVPGWTSTILLIIVFSSIIIFSQYILITYFGRAINKKKFK